MRAENFEYPIEPGTIRFRLAPEPLDEDLVHVTGLHFRPGARELQPRGRPGHTGSTAHRRPLGSTLPRPPGGGRTREAPRVGAAIASISAVE